MDEELERQTRRRAEQLRRIAQEEVGRHRERHGYRAAALDGSLASGALWPSSDLDFTLVPLPGRGPGPIPHRPTGDTLPPG